MIYRISKDFLLAHICTNKELMDYDAKEKEWVLNEEKLSTQKRTMENLGVHAFMRAKRTNEVTMCRYFTALVNPIKPFNQLIIEN